MSSGPETDTFVVVTRYVSPKGRVIMHVWGPPHSTRSKARTHLNRHKRDQQRMWGNDPRLNEVEYSVVRMHQDD